MSGIGPFVRTQLVDHNGKAIETKDGKIPVDAQVNLDSVEINDITIKDAMNSNNKLAIHEDGSVSARVVNQYPEHRGLSTDNKPSPKVVGETFFEIDTGVLYMWDGTDWKDI